MISTVYIHVNTFKILVINLPQKAETQAELFNNLAHTPEHIPKGWWQHYFHISLVKHISAN